MIKAQDAYVISHTLASMPSALRIIKEEEASLLHQQQQSPYHYCIKYTSMTP
jgi:hypothetical protein